MKYSTTAFAVSAAILSGISKVAAHGGVLSYSNAGNWYWGWQPYNSPTGQTGIQRPWSTYNPIQDATDAQLACNDDGTSGALQLTATMSAGSTVTAYWNQIWPHNTGPLLTYLANCGGTTCTGVNAKTLKWFKIDQAGLLSGTVGSGSWANGKMIAQNSTWTSTIPASVPSGNYLIRFETIALHSLPAQFYPECAQINIVNGGSTAPSSSILVSLPGAYSNSDPGINIDLYSQASQTQTTYVIPGPPLYGGSGGTNPPPPPPTTSSTTARTTATTTAHTTTTTSTTVRTTSLTTHTTTTTASGGGGGTAPHWGQCGGIGWTGPTQCAAGTTCQVSNPYYSQCL